MSAGNLTVRIGLILLAAAGSAVASGTPIRMRVIEGRAPVCTATNQTRETVLWLPAGAEVELFGALADGQEWVRVTAPPALALWVYRELVRDGHVTADKSQVRTGPGQAFPVVAQLGRGDPVTVRGTYGDWLRIAPPAQQSFWMVRGDVEPLALPAPEKEPDVADTPEDFVLEGEEPAEEVSGISSPVPPPVAERILPPVPSELSAFVLDEAREQGRPTERRGILDWGGVGSVSTPFCLVGQREAGGEMAPVCHLILPVATYGPHIGAAVSIAGTEWHVNGSALPVLIPARVRLEIPRPEDAVSAPAL